MTELLAYISHFEVLLFEVLQCAKYSQENIFFPTSSQPLVPHSPFSVLRLSLSLSLNRCHQSVPSVHPSSSSRSFLPRPSLSLSVSQPAVESSQINQFRFPGQTSGVARNWPFPFSVCLRASVCLHSKQREAVRAKSLSASELMVPSSVAVPAASH